MTITLKQIGASFKKPRPIILAFVFNLALAPLVAMLIAKLFGGLLGDLAQTILIAAVLINLFAGAPAGMKNVQIAKGDPVLGVALLGVLSVSVAIITPFSAKLFLPGAVEVPILSILLTLVLLLIVPLGIGLLTRAKLPKVSKKVAHPLSIVSTVFMVLVMLLYLIPNVGNIIKSGWFVFLVFFVIFAINFVISYFFTFGTVVEKKTVSMISMSKNFGVALSIASTAFASYDLVPHMMTYALMMLIGGLPTALVLRHVGVKHSGKPVHDVLDAEHPIAKVK